MDWFCITKNMKIRPHENISLYSITDYIVSTISKRMLIQPRHNKCDLFINTMFAICSKFFFMDYGSQVTGIRTSYLYSTQLDMIRISYKYSIIIIYKHFQLTPNRFLIAQWLPGALATEAFSITCVVNIEDYEVLMVVIAWW